MGEQTPAPDHKRLLLLGLLRDGPRHGYELNRIVRAHGTLYADLGRANIYYLLDRMSVEGLVTVRSVPGTRGSRGARLVYRITEAGRRRFAALLRAELVTYDAVHPGVDVAVVLAGSLPVAETAELLRARRDVVTSRRAETLAELAVVPEDAVLPRIAADHLRTLIDAELAWIDRSLAVLGGDESDRLGCRDDHDGTTTGQSDRSRPGAERHPNGSGTAGHRGDRG